MNRESRDDDLAVARSVLEETADGYRATKIVNSRFGVAPLSGRRLDGRFFPRVAGQLRF